MTGIATGANEVVETHPERLGKRLELVRVAVDEGLCGFARRFRGEHVLERVLVGSSKEPHRFAQSPAGARGKVSLDQFVRIANVRFGVHVRDRNRDVGRHVWYSCEDRSPGSTSDLRSDPGLTRGRTETPTACAPIAPDEGTSPET